jgi:seryl-tRNA synthetase
MVDLERGTKVAGFRGYFLKNDGALLQFALFQFVLDHFSAKRVYADDCSIIGSPRDIDGHWLSATK